MDRHILIIDGNEKMRQLLAANLGGAGYGSLGVANGLDAAMSMPDHASVHPHLTHDLKRHPLLTSYSVAQDTSVVWFRESHQIE